MFVVVQVFSLLLAVEVRHAPHCRSLHAIARCTCFFLLPRPSRAPAQLALGRQGANCPEHPAVVAIVVVGVGVRVGVGVAAGVVVALVAAAEYSCARI